MKILLFPAYFYPEQMASSHLDDDRYCAFANKSIEMECYTPMPTRGINNIIRENYKKRKLERMYENRMKVIRFSMFREPKNSMFRALRYIFCWVIQFWKGLFVNDVDLIYIVSTPPIQGVLGALLKKIKKIPFIYNLQDIFPDSLVGTGLAKKDGILWKIGRVIENYTYRNADKIIVISEDFKRNIMAKGVPEEKIEVIYNWVDEEAVIPIPYEENYLFEEFHINRNKFNVVYAGNLGNAQNVSVIIDAAIHFKGFPDLQFIIFGSGGMEEELRELVKSNQLNNVLFFPLQPYDKVAYVYGIGNVCVVSCKKGLGGSAMPSKTWNIMSSGRAVLANFDEGELEMILKKNKCGLFSKAGDSNDFFRAIETLYKNPSFCDSLGRNGREFILNNLTKEVGVRKYVDIIMSYER